ncbi:MAG TPA: SRPBCC family protein [Actinomycetales bacterium]
MDLQHTFTVPIGIEAAWAAFTDLEGIAPCFPGAVITSVDGDDFTGTAKVKLGPIALMYSGKGVWVSRDGSAYQAVIEASGKDKRGNGTASATITAHLEPGDGVTHVFVDTDLRITGRPAQFGRGVIQDVGSKILDQFATCLSERMGQDGAAALAEASGEPDAAQDPSAGDAAAAPATSGPSTQADASTDVPDVGATQPDADPTSASTPTPAPAPVPTLIPTPAPAATAPPPPRLRAVPDAEPLELDLGGVVGPVLLQRYGPTALACLVTAVITWLVARRR